MKKNNSSRSKSRFKKDKKKTQEVDPVAVKMLSNKRMQMDFESSILDKLSNSYTESTKGGNGSQSTWKYTDVISKEKQFKYGARPTEEGKTFNYNNQSGELDEEEKANGKSSEDKFENELFEKNCSFSDFKLSKLLLKACADLNFFHPTKVQAKVIPLITEKNDVLVNAETGSGKTACYLLPTLQRILLAKNSINQVKVLIILPTRELALQCSQMLTSLLKYMDSIRFVAITGGMSSDNQIHQLQSEPDIILATPGRLIDMIYNYKSINLDFINVLILDEADKLLELGFKDAILEILNKMGRSTTKNNKDQDMPTNKRSIQALLFSATLNPKVIDLGNTVLRNPIKLKLAHSSLLSNLKQSIIRMRFVSKGKSENENNYDNDNENEDENENENAENEKSKAAKTNKFQKKIDNKSRSRSKRDLPTLLTNQEFMQRMSYLIALLQTNKRKRSIIFFNTKLDCHKAFVILKAFGLTAVELHSDIHQTNRLEALENFQSGKIDYLLATDVVGRGIDVEKVKCVINFQMPLHEDRYIHRIGRTARKGNMGHAITICNDNDRSIFKKLLKAQKFELHPLVIANDEIKQVYSDLKSKQSSFNHELEEDAIDKELQLAEMQVDKAINKEKNLDEIKNRPKKQWYQTKTQKQELQKQIRNDFEKKISGISK